MLIKVISPYQDWTWTADNLLFVCCSCQQDLVGLSHFGGFVFYPYSSFPAASAQYLMPPVQSRVDVRAHPSIYSRDYFTSASISAPAPPVTDAGFKYFVPDLLTKTDQKTTMNEAESVKRGPDCSYTESQTGWLQLLLQCVLHAVVPPPSSFLTQHPCLNPCGIKSTYFNNIWFGCDFI